MAANVVCLPFSDLLVLLFEILQSPRFIWFFAKSFGTYEKSRVAMETSSMLTLDKPQELFALPAHHRASHSGVACSDVTCPWLRLCYTHGI